MSQELHEYEAPEFLLDKQETQQSLHAESTACGDPVTSCMHMHSSCEALTVYLAHAPECFKQS